MRDSGGEGEGEGGVERVVADVVVLVLFAPRGRGVWRAASAASSSRRLHCRQEKPSFVSQALHSVTSVAPGAFVEKPGLHFLHTGVGSLTVPPVL